MATITVVILAANVEQTNGSSKENRQTVIVNTMEYYLAIEIDQLLIYLVM